MSSDEEEPAARFGGEIAPDLKSARITSGNVTVSISAGSGTTLALSEAQVRELVARVQAALRKQAERNKKSDGETK